MFHAKYQYILASGSWEEDFLKIYQNFPDFAPYWAPKGASPFLWTNLNPHPSRFLNVFVIEAYIKLCPLRAWSFMTPGTAFEQIWIFLPQGWSMPNITALRSVVLLRYFKIDQHFTYFAPKGASPFIWTNLNLHLPSMFPTEFGRNWPSSSWEEDF